MLHLQRSLETRNGAEEKLRSANMTDTHKHKNQEARVPARVLMMISTGQKSVNMESYKRLSKLRKHVELRAGVESILPKVVPDDCKVLTDKQDGDDRVFPKVFFDNQRIKFLEELEDD